jgi:hypothetical protein
MPPTTPPIISLRIKRFIQTLGNVGAPIYLPFTFRSDDYLPRHCQSNCEAESIRSSSEIAFGWVIWESRIDHFLEAEFHAVIRQNGSLFDITPRVDGESKVLYVRDFARSAVRIDDRTWDTWSNHKLHFQQLEPAIRCRLQNSHPDLLV